MRKTIAAAGLAASLVAGGLVGAAVGTPGLAGAAESTTAAASWVQDALADLVGDGTITQDQADAVEAALDEARPGRGHGPGGVGLGFGRHFGRHLGGADLAEALGITEEELEDGLASGKSVAELATESGVDLEAVVDALLADVRTRVDEAVTEGRLTQEEADEHLARAEEAIRAFVDGEGPARGGRGGPHRGRGHGPRSGPWADESSAGADDGSTEGASLTIQA